MPFHAVAAGEILWDLLPAGRQLGDAPASFIQHAHALGAGAEQPPAAPGLLRRAGAAGRLGLRVAGRPRRHHGPSGRGPGGRGAVKRFGRVDTLVNNAGIFIAKPFTEYTAADFAHMLAVNLAGFFHVSQRAVRQMLAQGGGHIMNLTTTLVNQPLKDVPSALASLTKGGLDAVTRSLAIEYADRGIRVNAVAPAVIKTPMHPPQTQAFLGGLHPIRRMGEVREVVEAVLYLESVAFVTGTTLHGDGGAHAGHW